MATAEDASPGAPRRRPRTSRRRLRSRIILSFLLLGVGLILALTVATNWARSRVENQLIEDVMNQNIDEYARRYYADPSTTPAVPFVQLQGYRYNTATAADMARLQQGFPEWVPLRDGIYGMRGVDEDGVPFYYKLAVRKTADDWFYLAYDMNPSLRVERQYKNALIGLVLLFILASALIGWWSASKVMSPVTDLARRLRQSGGTQARAPLAPQFADDEVGELAKALDDYSDRLTGMVERDREFNADVSHELRTPLAVIKGAVELLLDRPGIDEKTHARLLRIQRAEQQGTELISALLMLSRNERGHGNADIARLVEQLLDAHRAQVGSKPLVLRMEGEPGLVVDAPEEAVSVALGNLIGNAVKYTREGEVVVRLFDDRVEVIDSGPGISKEDADRLFRRGYRGSHAEHTQGGGIGLSIVQRLCELYGWKAQVSPGVERGVVATLRFS